MLPKVVLPSVKCHLPILNKDVKVTAINLQTEKSMLITSEAGNEEELEEIMIDIVKSSISDSSIDVDELTLPDIISLFVSLVDVSKGSVMNGSYICQAIDKETNEKCNTKISVDIDLKKYKLVGKTDNNLYKINDEVSIQMKYPSYRNIVTLKKLYPNETDYILRLLASCIECVYFKDEVITEFSNEEIYQWMLQLPQSTFSVFKKFIEEMPMLELEVEVVCPKCGAKKTFVYKGLSGFFMQGMRG